ncbi:MAG: response regulator [Bacteroidetes bacterium]|nr:response regulator [Bacteroidota bacterium]
MKISLRIILINFVVVVLVMGVTAIAFYSIMYKTLTSQKSKGLITSANNFAYAYHKTLLNSEDEFIGLTSENIDNIFRYRNLRTNNLDFVLEAQRNGKKRIIRKSYTSDVNIPKKPFTLDRFLEHNPYAIISEAKDSERVIYYGLILDEELLNELAGKISADVAVIWNDIPAYFSNSAVNKNHIYILAQAGKYLNGKKNFEIYTQGIESNDILATLYKPATDHQHNKEISFLMFTQMGEAAELRSTLRDLFITIGITGIALSLILTFLFTGKLRKQIIDLSNATEKTKLGDFQNKITIRSKDEIGKLGQAFNLMLDELAKNQKAKKEYSEFITLINQNPSLNEISEAALNKIISTCGFVVGALYSVEDDELRLLSAYGFEKAKSVKKENFGFSDRVVQSKEIVEIVSEDELPVVSVGLVNFKLKYLLLVPVIYNNKVISVLELGSVNKPTEEAREYLEKIKDQLAIGLTNAKALVQLEDFVGELKKLNDDYYKQNVKIKKQNDSLVKLHQELKEQAGELEIQKQKAVESTKLKSQFLASMSHELRTPMNSILGLTELIIEKADLNEKNQERLGVVLNSGRRLMTLINDILDLSKIEAGKMEIRTEEVLLEELIGEVSNSISPLVMNKGIEFNIEREINTRIVIHTDRGRLVQVLINLLGNATKFTEKGEVKLKISSSDERLVFDVIDTGIGISEEDQKVVFEEFRQADGSSSRKYGGTGLGLSICKKIADLLGGNLSLISKMGYGSTFTFKIPLKYVSSNKKEISDHIDVSTLIKNRRHPILIIDDNKEVRYTIGQYLTSRGYEVIFAEDGDKGIQMAIDKQPFAITLDIMMPKKDGWSVLKELKENEVTKDIPVIVISINGDKQIGYGVSAFEYFIKPISADKLLSVISRLESLAKKRIQKIVLVDDDEFEFEKFKSEFKDEQISIEYIKDSEFAFNKIAEVQPDLIILDLMMPKVDGITLSYKLKSDIRTKHIPILISTAKDLSEDERKSLNNIVEDIAVKSKGHPLDVLKVVRDRIELHEQRPKVISAGDNEQEINSTEESIEIEETKEYMGEVLIVDDDPDTLFTIDEMVKDCNCKTILAKNGIECMEVLKHSTPDLILLDIMMPEMDGFETIKSIRKDEKVKDIPVFAVTARAMANDKDIILKHGFNDYIPKPVKSTIITFKINQVFKKNRCVSQ